MGLVCGGQSCTRCDFPDLPQNARLTQKTRLYKVGYIIPKCFTYWLVSLGVPTSHIERVWRLFMVVEVVHG